MIDKLKLETPGDWRPRLRRAALAATLVALTAAGASAGSKVAFNSYLFPSNVIVDSSRSLDWCLVNDGEDAALQVGDTLSVLIPTGPAQSDLEADGAAIGCAAPPIGWDCMATVEAGAIRVEVGALVPSLLVAAGESVCFELTGLHVNSVEGFAHVGLEQAIPAARAQAPQSSGHLIFKSSSGTILHDDLGDVRDDQHHVKTTLFSELVDTATDAQIPDDITIDFATTAGNADTLDGNDSLAFVAVAGDDMTGELRIAVPPGTPALETSPGARVGVGTGTPKAGLHVRGAATTSGAGPTPEDHLVFIENTATGAGNGLAILLKPSSGASGIESVSSDDNFITFFSSDDRIVGRIEGESVEDLAGLNDVLTATALPAGITTALGVLDFDFNFTIDTDFVHFDAGYFSTGTLPSLSGGSPPSLSGGSLPSLSPGRLPSLDIDFGAFEFSFDRGSPPSLSPGSFPSLSPGSFPALFPGSLPSFNPARVRLESPFIPGDPFLEIGNDSALQSSAADLFLDTSGLGLRGWQAFQDPVSHLIRSGQAALGGGGVTYESGSGDYAEWLERLEASETIRVGDIVGVFGGKISKRTDGADHVMAVSFKPIVLGKMPQPDRQHLHEKVAFMGQIPVKVRGRVELGDFILPDGFSNGIGRAVRPEQITAAEIGQVVGVAWSESDFWADVSFINVAVGLRPAELTGIVGRLQETIDELRADSVAALSQLAAVSARLDELEAHVSGDQR